MSKATVTKAHRLLVAEAWEGDHLLSGYVRDWVNGKPELRRNVGVEETLRSLDRIAKAIADAELRGVEGKAGAWVACSERLPERREWVLLLLSDKKQPYRVAYWDDRDNDEPEATQAPFWCSEDSWFGDVGDTDLIRGWQPLPPPPSSEAK